MHVIRKNDSCLVRKIFLIHDEILVRGLVDDFKVLLSGWFDGKNDMYSFFAPDYGNWPCKPLEWKNFLIPKHKFYVWLLVVGSSEVFD